MKNMSNSPPATIGRPLLLASMLAMFAAAPALAQSQVTIESFNGNVSVSGELLSYDDNTIVIKSTVGDLKFNRDGFRCIGDGCPADVEPETETRVVVLRSPEDGTQVRGELVDVSSTHYVIQTSLGQFRIAADQVECGGAACPTREFHDNHFAIHGMTPETGYMMASLLEGYASDSGYSYEATPVDSAPEVVRVLDAGTVLAEVSFDYSENLDNSLAGNSADLLLVGRDQVGGRDDGVRETLIGHDGQVIIANRDNPIRNLSQAEISRIWRGNLKNWRSLGAGDFPLTVHMVAPAAGSSEEAWLGGLSTESAQGFVTHGSEEDVLQAVRNDRNAIGIVHRAVAARAGSKMLDLRKACGLTASPSDFDIGIDNYPYSQPVVAYGLEKSIHPFARDFLTWTQGANAQSQVKDLGYASPRLQRMRIEDMGVAVVHSAAVEPDFSGEEFAAMMRELRSADRLSITFRFRPGSSSLDAESEESARDLAERLRQNEFANQEVLLVGFADSVGPADRNSELSVRRAEAVREILAGGFGAQDAEQLQTLGFGEQMPLDCNDTDTGRANNRRVEVWVRVNRNS